MKTYIRTRAVATAAALALSMGSASLVAGSGESLSLIDRSTQSTDSLLGDKARQDEKGTFLVFLQEPPAARYRGGIDGLAATSPSVTGSKRFQNDTAAVQTYQSFLQQRQEAVLADIARMTGVSLNPQRRWQLALNGFAVDIDAGTARKIQALPGVKLVKREIVYEPMTFAGPTHINAPPVWDGSATGVESKGEGTVIAIVDSGIRPTHESFAEVSPGDGYVHENPLGSGNFIGVCDPGHPNYDATYQCNDKLIGAFYFNGSTAFDDNGHGTHVAGTAAGNELTTPNGLDISGVAPRANIINYRVCAPGCVGMPDVAEDILSRGDLVDAVNYSIGPTAGGGNPYAEGSALAFLSLNEAGILVAAAGGNSGPGAETISNFGPWNLTVASITHGGVQAQPVSVTGPGSVPGELVQMAGVPSNGFSLASDINADLVSAADAGDALACDALAANSMDGAIGVAARGDCPFVDKAQNIAAAGAIGMIVTNNEAGAPIPMGGDNFAVPSVMISLDDGGALYAWINAEAGATGEIGAEPFMAALGGDVMSGFSSRGPGNGSYKAFPGPDVAAPGDNVLAAWVDSDTGYNSIGGTSMASPHAAGAILLMRSLYPDWTAQEVQSALMMSAEPDPVVMQDGSTPAKPMDRGNGRVDIGAAAQAGLVLDETRANFEAANPSGGSLELYELNVAFLSNPDCEDGGCSWTRTFTAVKDGDWTASGTGDGFDVDVSPSSFSLNEGQTQTITVTVSNATAVEGWQFGELTISEDAGNASDARLPIMVDIAAPPPPPVEGGSLDLDGVQVPGGMASALELQIIPGEGMVSGLSWDLTVETLSDAWSDEFRMEIEDPQGNLVLAGGAAGAWNAPGNEVLDYDFGWPSTAGTNSDQRSIDDFNDLDAEGTWTVRLWNTYGSGAMALLTDGSALEFEIASDAVAAPTLDPDGGFFTTGDAVSVTVEQDADGVTIHYTLDGSDPARDHGEAIDSGNTVSVSGDHGDTITVKAFAFDADGDEADDSDIVIAEFTFYDAIAIEDGSGSPVGSPEVGSGGSVPFSASGGAGEYDVDAMPNTVSGAEGVLTGSDGNYSFEVPSEGAFAGVYTIVVTDPDTGWSESFDITVALEMDAQYDELLTHGDRSEIRVRGATVGYGFTFSVEDSDGMDASSIATMDPDQADAEDNSPQGNPARADMVTLAGTDAATLQVRATPSDGSYDDAVVEGLSVDPGQNYSGWIHDDTASGLEGVTVVTQETMGSGNIHYSTETNEEGVFHLITPAPEGEDEHNLVASLSGYLSKVFSGEGCVGAEPQCTKVLLSATATISGTVHGLGEGEELNLFLVDGETEVGPAPVTGAGTADDAFALDTDPDIHYSELRARGFGFEQFATDNGGDGFSFEGPGDSIDNVDVAAIATTPIIESLTANDIGEDAASIVAEVDANERATTVTLSYGSSDDDLDSSLDDVSLSATDGLTELGFELDGLSCGAAVFYQVSAVNDRDNDSHSDVETFTTADCASDDDDDDDADDGDGDGDSDGDGDGNGGGSSGCSLSDSQGPMDPLMPLLALMALIGLIARRRV